MENRQDRVRDVFLAAAELPPEQRAAYLDQTCGSDAELRSAIQRLIDADGSTGSFIAPEVAIPRFAAGTILAERFRVVRYIAAGGMGDVYEVEDIALNERLALKTVRPEAVGNEKALARFKREILYAKRVSHPNVCRIHDLGTHREGQTEILFLTMELLRGETLAHRLRTAGRIAPPDALPWVVQMAEGLAAAHEAGIIHRDFKTSNVMLAGSEAAPKAVITDFGLARQNVPGEDASLTESGLVVGTPAYMAPEQLSHGEVTPATDVYALGLVIYEMITGRRPFRGATPMQAAMERLRQPAPSPSQEVPGLDPRWEMTVMRCLERDPEQRFQNPKEVVRALTAIDAPTVTLSRPLLERIRFPGSRAAITVVFAFVLIAAAFAGVWMLGRHRPPDAAVRWYDEGTRALRDGTTFTAMKAFEQAVQLDGDFTLAHARLAEAATELDYMDKAKTEMLRASPPAYRAVFLWGDEKLRLEAVYFTLVRDFARSAAIYKDLAAKVGKAEKAAVLVDLGRAYESAGKIPEALASYSDSARRDNQYAAAFLRRGILQAKQQQPAKASADFDTAEQLYRTEGKAEGLTEVLYQRSLLLRSGKLAEARAFTEKVLEMARESGDEYHQIKALLLLSYISYNSGDTVGGREQAQQGIDLARRAGIEVLAASGLVDVGNTLFIKGDYGAADPYLRAALETARRFQAVRIEARAELALGQVLVKEGHTQEAIAVLKQALEHFQQAGEKNNAARTALLSGRMLRDQGEYQAAADMLRGQLQSAAQVKDDRGVVLAAQSLGSVLLLQEQYPAALAAFDQSAAVSHAIADQGLEGFSQVSRADVLSRLGRYPEAAEALKGAEALARQLGGNKPMLLSVYTSRASMDLSEHRFSEAEQDIRQMRDATADSPAVDALAKRFLGLVRIATGRARDGRKLCEESLEQARQTLNVPLIENAQLAVAEAKLESGDAAEARLLAAGLATQFASRGQNESQLRALSIAAAASQGEEKSEFDKRAKAVLEKSRQSLGSDVFVRFVSRPDIHSDLSRLGLTFGIQ